MGRGTRGTGLPVGVRSSVLRLGGGKVKGRIPSGGKIGYAVAGGRFRISGELCGRMGQLDADAC